MHVVHGAGLVEAGGCSNELTAANAAPAAVHSTRMRTSTVRTAVAECRGEAAALPVCCGGPQQARCPALLGIRVCRVGSVEGVVLASADWGHQTQGEEGSRVGGQTRGSAADVVRRSSCWSRGSLHWPRTHDCGTCVAATHARAAQQLPSAEAKRATETRSPCRHTVFPRPMMCIFQVCLKWVPFATWMGGPPVTCSWLKKPW
jgi:hypothetical protein